MDGKLMNLTQWQKQRIHVMETILPTLGSDYILKGGTALMFFYHLDRFSDDIDLDARGSMIKAEKSIQYIAGQNGWKYRITKNTDTVFRMMIDYGGKNDLGDYPLKLEISGRNKNWLNNGLLETKEINGIYVYDLKVLVGMKLMAFAHRDKIRDFYDIAFLIRNHEELFTKEQLTEVKYIMDYKGMDFLAKFLEKELKTHSLSQSDAEELVLNTFIRVEKIVRERDSKISKEINPGKKSSGISFGRPQGGRERE